MQASGNEDRTMRHWDEPINLKAEKYF